MAAQFQIVDEEKVKKTHKTAVNCQFSYSIMVPELKLGD